MTSIENGRGENLPQSAYEFTGCAGLECMLTARGSRVRSIKAQNDPILSGLAGKIPGLTFEFMNVQGDPAIKFDSGADHLMFIFPSLGAMEFTAGNELIETNVRQAAMVDGRMLRNVTHDGPCQHSLIGIAREVFTERLSQMMGQPISVPPRFHSAVTLDHGRMNSIAAFAHCLTKSEFGAIFSDRMLVGNQLPGLFADMLLQTWPHSYMEQMSVKPHVIAPRHVKKVLDHIHGHLADLPDARGLADIAGVSLRALQYGFLEATGYTLSEYQRRLRLQRVAKDLSSATNETVKEIVERWGFHYSGRFSQMYKAYYGVLPSAARRN